MTTPLRIVYPPTCDTWIRCHMRGDMVFVWEVWYDGEWRNSLLVAKALNMQPSGFQKRIRRALAGELTQEECMMPSLTRKKPKAEDEPFLLERINVRGGAFQWRLTYNGRVWSVDDICQHTGVQAPSIRIRLRRLEAGTLAVSQVFDPRIGSSLGKRHTEQTLTEEQLWHWAICQRWI